MSTNTINRRFVLIRIDEHGNRYLVQRAITRTEATEALARLLNRQTKPHHQTYDIMGYEVGSFSQFLASENILT